MRYTLNSYQQIAVRQCLHNLEQARDMYHRYKTLPHFALSATTGAGKTVMATAIIEALFYGNDEFDFAADPGAVVLWFSDDPALNEQSRTRIQSAAPDLGTRTKMIDSTTLTLPSLRPRTIYFLNTDKLAKTSRLVKGDRRLSQDPTEKLGPAGDDLQTSFYDVLANTLERDELTLYFILDEAHQGMGATSKDRGTIVQRLINGGNGVPPMPIVFGISATVERFELGMKRTTARTALPSVQVDAALVQASGLLKDDIVLSIPTESGVHDTVLLGRAIDKIRASTVAWDRYTSTQQDSKRVVPLLIVQVRDEEKSEEGKRAFQQELTRVVDTLAKDWPELGSDAIAHVFGEHQDLTVAGWQIPYIEPHRVQDATHVRVLLAKTAISTGWDCPRAEVLVSFRPAQDATHITQLLGRMIRTPLARRIDGEEILNSVDCLLPHFNRATATNVAEMLMKGATAKDEDATDLAAGGRRVLFDPVQLAPNPAIDPAVWEVFDQLPTVSIPPGDVKPIRRLTALAAALAKDEVMPGAVAKAHGLLHKALDGRAVQYDEKVAAARADVLTMSGEEAHARWSGQVTYRPFVESADPRAIEDTYRAAARRLSPALASSYVDHLTAGDDDDDLLEAHIVIASLGLVPEIVAGVEEEADRITREWLAETRVQRRGLSDERQVEYDRLEGMSTRPERGELKRPVSAQAETKVRLPDGTEDELPRRGLHLMAAEDGTYPIDLNTWETRVLDAESDQPTFAGWYRNPARSAKESLAVAYRDDSGGWKALRPDFVFFHTDATGGVVADLVDPHGWHLADALPKLRGLADFAEHHGQGLRRIETVAEIGGDLRVLDLTRPHVRDAVRSSTDARTLYASNVALDY